MYAKVSFSGLFLHRNFFEQRAFAILKIGIFDKFGGFGGGIVLKCFAALERLRRKIARYCVPILGNVFEGKIEQRFFYILAKKCKKIAVAQGKKFGAHFGVYGIRIDLGNIVAAQNVFVGCFGI